MNIEDLKPNQIAKLYQKHSQGYTREEWEKDDLVKHVCALLKIDAKELRARVSARSSGVHGI